MQAISASASFGCSRQSVRVPVLRLLVTLEPAVTFMLSSMALFGALTAFFWKLTGSPHFSLLPSDQCFPAPSSPPLETPRLTAPRAQSRQCPMRVTEACRMILFANRQNR